MKKALTSSLLTAEISAFAMLMLLFFMNTNKPFLLLIPIAVVICGFFVINALLRKFRDKSVRIAVALIVAMPIVLGLLIAAAVIGLQYIA